MLMFDQVATAPCTDPIQESFPSLKILSLTEPKFSPGV